jgi:AcrR family transcriptional regulator
MCQQLKELMTVDTESPSRRQRYRQQTLTEIKTNASVQISEGGPAAVSLNGIAKTMGMSPGALYRYFDNRDDLLAELVVDAYNDLGEQLEKAAAAANRRTRVRDVARAYRAWALAVPNSYRLIFETTSGSGHNLAPERIVPASQRSMNVFLAALSDAQPEGDSFPLTGRLRAQLQQWGARAQTDTPPAVLYLALTFWSRLHGFISLELGGHMSATGVAPDLLFEAEIHRLTSGLASG